MRELVDYVQHADLASILGTVLNEVVGPDVVGMLWPKPDAGSIVEPEPASLGLPGRHLQTLAPPDPFDAFIVDDPARIPQQGRDLAIAVATIPARQFDEIDRELLFVVAAPRYLMLCRTVLPEGAADPPLGQLRHRHDVVGTGAPA